MLFKVLIALLLVAAPLAAQESQFQADLRRQGEDIKESCSALALKAIGSCAIELATGDPFHLALGNLAPQNGFGFGLAFVEHYTPEGGDWRLGWNADAVRAIGGSWRAGAYMKIVQTKVESPTVLKPGESAARNPNPIHAYPIYKIYLQTTSLEKLFFFGLGQNSAEADKSVFGMRQTIVGGSAIYPLTKFQPLRALNLSLLGAVNGRFVDIRGNGAEPSPSIEQRYDDLSAPGLSRQPGFLQLTEGVRLQPSWFGGRLQPDYLVSFDQFHAGSDARSSFRRWTLDLNHTVPLYSTARSSFTRETNGPDECFQGPDSTKCPTLSLSRNRGGSIGFRLMVSGSSASSGHAVPFYFQPTLGGSDINGNASLPSFEDYRFRGPNVILLQESFEHSIWGPLGFEFLATQGKVTMKQGDLSFGGLSHSFATGLTVRAGGFPQISLLFAFGGGEGTHVIGRMNSSLLGGSPRPPLN